MSEEKKGTPIWDCLFMSTVVGDSRSLRCEFSDGTFGLVLNPKPKESQKNLFLVAQLLRSDEPITRFIRDELADLFDESAKSEYRFELKRRARGVPKEAMLNSDIAKFVVERNEQGQKMESCIQEACEKFGLKKRAIQNAVKSYREGMEEYYQIMRECEE